MAAPRQGAGVRRNCMNVLSSMVTLLLAASSASAGDGHNGVPLQKHSYFERDVFIARNGTCNMADQRVIGWPSDICNGHHNVSKVIDLVTRYAEQFDGQFEYGHDYTMQQLRQCAAHASPFFCASYFYFQPWGSTFCDNKKPHSFFDGSFDSDQDTTHTVNLGMGCSITCDCCGNQCHSVKFVSAAEDLWADTDATESPRGEAPRKLLVFFHSYRGDSTHALSKYYLDQLVQEHNYLVVALEGRYDDLGYAHWLGTDHFTGFFIDAMDDNGERITSDDPWLHHNITRASQYQVLHEHNMDITYIKKVLNYTFENFNIDPNHVIAMGDGLGADMALQAACQMSDVFTAVVSHNGVGYMRDYNRYCNPTQSMHVLHIQQDLTFNVNGLVDGSSIEVGNDGPDPSGAGLFDFSFSRRRSLLHDAKQHPAAPETTTTTHARHHHPPAQRAQDYAGQDDYGSFLGAQEPGEMDYLPGSTAIPDLRTPGDDEPGEMDYVPGSTPTAEFFLPAGEVPLYMRPSPPPPNLQPLYPHGSAAAILAGEPPSHTNEHQPPAATSNNNNNNPRPAAGGGGARDGGELEREPARGGALVRYGINTMNVENIVTFWTQHNRCSDTRMKPGNLVRSLQVFYDGSQGQPGRDYSKMGSSEPMPDTVVYEMTQGCAADGSVTVWRSRADPGAVLHPRKFTDALHSWVSTHSDQHELPQPHSLMAQSVPLAELMEQSSVMHESSALSSRHRHPGVVSALQTVMACMPLALLVVGGYLAFRYHRRLRSSLTSAYKQVPAEDPYGTFAATTKGQLGAESKAGKARGGASTRGAPRAGTPRVVGALLPPASVAAAGGSSGAPSSEPPLPAVAELELEHLRPAVKEDADYLDLDLPDLPDEVTVAAALSAALALSVDTERAMNHLASS